MMDCPPSSSLFFVWCCDRRNTAALPPPTAPPTDGPTTLEESNPSSSLSRSIPSSSRMWSGPSEEEEDMDSTKFLANMSTFRVSHAIRLNVGDYPSSARDCTTTRTVQHRWPRPLPGKSILLTVAMIERNSNFPSFLSPVWEIQLS